VTKNSKRKLECCEMLGIQGRLILAALYLMFVFITFWYTILIKKKKDILVYYEISMIIIVCTIMFVTFSLLMCSFGISFAI
jgi:hypothetical protein